MKTDANLPLNLSPNFAGQGTNNAAKSDPNLNPYLKAMLTGAVNLAKTGKTNASSRNPDLEAAIRYIKESAMLRK